LISGKGLSTSSNRKSHPRPRLRSPAIHHQDDDFEVDRRNNSKVKAVHSETVRCARASWDDELELEAKYNELDDNAEFRRRDEEEGRSDTVTARSWGAALSRFASSLPPYALPL
jgi:hypothetical protein